MASLRLVLYRGVATAPRARTPDRDRGLMALKAAGLRIPEDMAFAGFNNDPISKIIEPNLTTINYSGYDIGEAAVTSLINHLNGIANVKTTNTIILRSDLIIRASSLKNKSL